MFNRLSRRERKQVVIQENIFRVLQEATETDRVPVALAVGKRNGSWIIECPYCGNQHIHAMHEGLRMAHCQNYCGVNRNGFNLMYTIKLKPGIKLISVSNPTSQENTLKYEKEYLNKVALFLK